MYFYFATATGFHGNRRVFAGKTCVSTNKLSAKWLDPIPKPKGQASLDEMLSVAISLDVDASPTATKKAAKAGPANAEPNTKKATTSSDVEIV